MVYGVVGNILIVTNFNMHLTNNMCKCFNRFSALTQSRFIHCSSLIMTFYLSTHPHHCTNHCNCRRKEFIIWDFLVKQVAMIHVVNVVLYCTPLLLLVVCLVSHHTPLNPLLRKNSLMDPMIRILMHLLLLFCSTQMFNKSCRWLSKLLRSLFFGCLTWSI